ncbi:hypothetical protein JCM39194_17520 [Desulfotomaculum varum]
MLELLELYFNFCQRPQTITGVALLTLFLIIFFLPRLGKYFYVLCKNNKEARTAKKGKIEIEARNFAFMVFLVSASVMAWGLHYKLFIKSLTSFSQ